MTLFDGWFEAGVNDDLQKIIDIPKKLHADALQWKSIISDVLECAEAGAESVSLWHVWVDGHEDQLRERGFSVKAEGDQIIVGWDRDTLERECNAVGYSCSWSAVK